MLKQSSIKSEALIIFSVLFLFVIGFAVMSVHAEETDDVVSNSDVMPIGDLCPNCGVGEMIKKTETGNWILLNKFPCSHCDHGYDYNYKREVKTYWKCSDCDYALSETVSSKYEYKTICSGYD